MKESYDVAVIGAGSGGLTSAVGLAKIGKRVLLVEREHMGGECTNSGCVPSKALLHHAKAYYQATKIAGQNNQTEEYRKGALDHVQNKIKEVLNEETEEHFQKIGITVVIGEARFISRCKIAIGTSEYGFKKAIIATGSSPRPLIVPGLEEGLVLTNQNIFDLSEIPKDLLIIGSGPIGLELGQAFAMLGSKVTITTIDSELGKYEDVSIRPILEKACIEFGIVIKRRANVRQVVNTKAILDFDNGTSEEVNFDKVLVAIGRVANIPEGLEKAGILNDKNGITVDSQYRTSNKSIYALGDVAQRLKFTHTADDTARQVVTRIATKGLLGVKKNKAVPKVTYTEPEIAQVGMGWQEAVGAYGADRLLRIEVPLSAVDRAKTDDLKDGVLVVIAKRLSGKVLGAHYIGPRAGEIIAVFTLAIDNKISLWKLRRTIYAYPSYALIIKKAGDYFFASQVKSLRQDLLRVAKKSTPKIIALIFWLTLIASFQQYKAINDLSYQDILFLFYDFFTMSMYGPLIYIVLYAIRPLIFFPATLLTALSGALFGFWWGVLYTIIGENASANFAYWIGRYFGKDMRLEESIIGNWIEAMRKNAFSAILFMRLFYIPFDLTNYGAGVVGAKWRAYFLATLIGIIPGLTTFVALGAAVNVMELKETGISFNAFDPLYLIISVSIFVTSIFISKIIKRWHTLK